MGVKMKPTKILWQLISSLLEVPVMLWDGKKESLIQFEENNCLLPAVQTLLTADALELFCTSMKKHCLYELQDLLGLRLLLFLYEDQVMIMGPFVEKQWDDTEGSILLAKRNLSATYFIPYKMYYCGYSVVEMQTAQHTILTTIQVLTPDLPVYKNQILSGFKSETIPPDVYEEPLGFDLAVRRYQAENKFISMIQKGKPQAAQDAFAMLGHMLAGLSFPYRDAKYFIANFSIIRTLARKAAERAGVHPAVVDAVSQDYARKAYTARSQKEVELLQNQMIQEFSEAVQTVLLEKYSPVVHKAVNYIKLHLGNPLPLEEIAKAANITPNYLSHAFKRETGSSVLRYIAEKRCEKAAELLHSSTLTVQDISMLVGYSDNNYFVKVFKSQYHMTPTAYRKSRQVVV